MPQMLAQELAAAQMRVAMKSVEHLCEWLEASNRRWLVFDALELVKSLPWPNGVEALMQIIACYRDHRAAQASGRTEELKHSLTGELSKVPIMKGDQLEIEELDRAIRYLIGIASTKDTTWSIDRSPL